LHRGIGFKVQSLAFLPLGTGKRTRAAYLLIRLFADLLICQLNTILYICITL